MIFEQQLQLQDTIRRALTEHHLQNQLQKIKLRKPKIEQPFKIQSSFQRLENEKWIDIFEKNRRIHKNISNIKSVLRTCSNDLHAKSGSIKQKSELSENCQLPLIKPRSNTLLTR